MWALTIRQPWAWAIIRGWKDCENRAWRPREVPEGGRFLVHAGRMDDDRRRDRCLELIMAHNRWDASRVSREMRDDPLSCSSAILGDVQFAGLSDGRVSPWAENATVWGLSDPLPAVKPAHRVKGRVGLWRPPEGLLQRCEACGGDGLEWCRTCNGGGVGPDGGACLECGEPARCRACGGVGWTG